MSKISTSSQSSDDSAQMFECQMCKLVLGGRDMRKHIMESRHKRVIYLENSELIQCEECGNDNIHVLELVRFGGYDFKCLCKDKKHSTVDLPLLDNNAVYDVSQNGQLFQYWGSYIDFSNVKCKVCSSEDSLNISSSKNSSEIICDGCLKKTNKSSSGYYSEDSGQFLYKFLHMTEPPKKTASKTPSKFKRNKKMGSSKRGKKELTKQELEDRKYQDIKAKNRILQKSDVNLSQFQGINTGQGKVASVLSSVLKPKKSDSRSRETSRKSTGPSDSKPRDTNPRSGGLKNASRKSNGPSTSNSRDTSRTSSRTGDTKSRDPSHRSNNPSDIKTRDPSHRSNNPSDIKTRDPSHRSNNPSDIKTRDPSHRSNTPGMGKKSDKRDSKTQRSDNRDGKVSVPPGRDSKKSTDSKSQSKTHTKSTEKNSTIGTSRPSSGNPPAVPTNNKGKNRNDVSEEGVDLFTDVAQAVSDKDQHRSSKRLKPRTQFNNIDEYLDYLSYFFYLEQRFELNRESLTRFDLEWGKYNIDADDYDNGEADDHSDDGENKGNQFFKIVLPYSSQNENYSNEYSWPDNFINLRRLPFGKNQGMILVRNLPDGSNDFNNDYDKYKDNFWYCSVVDIKPISIKDLKRGNTRGNTRGGGRGGRGGRGGYRGKPGKAPKLVKSEICGFQILLSVFPWCKNLNRLLPQNELYTNFQILPCIEQMNRVFGAMSKLNNIDFQKILIGKPDLVVKDIHYNNNLNFYNSGLNDSQMDSVNHSLNNRVSIIQGPPGTGKTSTIVEIIKQLVLTLRNYPILVVAASNIAIDNIAEKLLSSDVSDEKIKVLRVLATSREQEYMKANNGGLVEQLLQSGGIKESGNDNTKDRDRLMDSCLHNIISTRMSDYDKKLFRKFKYNDFTPFEYTEITQMLDRRTKISDQIILQNQVILTTNVASGGKALHILDKIPYVIMDESTQSNEPYSLIPLSLPGIKRFIFVGDTKQLSSFSRIKELEKSLFERIIENKMVETPKILNVQYRMNPKISEWPIENCYNGELKDGVMDDLNKRITEKTYPLYFIDYSMDGKNGNIQDMKRISNGDKRQKNFSFYNPHEGDIVLKVLNKLINEMNIGKEKITVITPYSGQREYLSEIIQLNFGQSQDSIKRSNDKDELYEIETTHNTSNTINIIDGITVSSIDAYQGHENDVIIFSSVRSKPENGNIGFLNDQRRLNVALTRSKKSLIVLGNRETLLKYGNSYWNSFIRHIDEKKLCFGDIDNYNNDTSLQMNVDATW